jgi:hypothetical protein
MPSPHDRPDPVELVVAVRELLEGELASVTSGAAAFHVRIAANVLAIVERELAGAPADVAAHEARLASLGCADDAELAARIRAGDLDDDPDVLDVLRAVVADKVRVTNPKYAVRDEEGQP